MKQLSITLLIILSTIILFTGCANLQIGGGSETINKEPTVGQQLIDLEKAKEAGAITEAEFKAEKIRLMGKK